MVKSFLAKYEAYFNYYKPMEEGLHKDGEYVALIDIKDFISVYRGLKTSEEKITLIENLVKGSLEDKVNKQNNKK